MAMGQMSLTTTIRLLAAAALVSTTALLAAAPMASGQQQTCTVSLLTSFTPCFSFLTNSSNGSKPPTRECCLSLAELVNASRGCACLVLTGAVPLPLPLPALGVRGVPVNRTLAFSLPKACNMSVPLKCRDPTSSAQSPAAGPVADTPSTWCTPASPAATTPATAPAPAPAPAPTSSARRTTSTHVATAPALAALLLAIAAAIV